MDNTLLSKMIGIVVAVVVVAVILVPICNSLAGSGNGGGGGEGSLSNPIPNIPMDYAEEGADSFTITIDAVKHDGEESEYPGLNEGYLTSLTITTPGGVIDIDVDARLTALSDFLTSVDPMESLIGNEDYLRVASGILIPLIASEVWIVYYDLAIGRAISFNTPYMGISDPVTQIVYDERNGEYGFDITVDGNEDGFAWDGGFYYVQKDGDFGAYTRDQFKDGLYVSNNYPLNPFYKSEITVNMGVYEIYNEARSVSMYDTAVGVTLNSSVSNHRLSNIGWDVSVTPHGSSQSTEYSTPPMIIFAPTDVDPNEPGKVYHNTGEMNYSKVTSSTNVTLYPYYNADDDVYGFSFQNPTTYPESVVTLDDTSLGIIYGVNWAAEIIDYTLDDEYVGGWNVYGIVGELADDPTSNHDYYGTISVINGVATFSGVDLVWDDATSQYVSTPAEFTLPTMLCYPNPDGDYVCPIVDGSHGREYSTIYADNDTGIIGIMGSFTDAEFIIQGTIGNSILTVIDSDDVTPDMTPQFEISNDRLVSVSIVDNGEVIASYDVEDGPYHDFTICVVSATVGEESGGNGSSSDPSDRGNDLGTAGTIIKIIPIFVILAILMGAAGLFYQNRNNPDL